MLIVFKQIVYIVVVNISSVLPKRKIWFLQDLYMESSLNLIYVMLKILTTQILNGKGTDTALILKMKRTDNSPNLIENLHINCFSLH